MAKKAVNKSAVVRDYLAKYPDKGPTALAEQIGAEKGLKVTGKFVATVKTKVKQTPASASPAAVPAEPSPPAAAVPAKAAPPAANKKPKPAKVKSAPVPSAPAPAGAAGLSQHIANLKAAALKLGKDEAKRIIDLF